MATEKTPAYKRIFRAEKSSQEWKMKAIARREEADSLKTQIKGLQLKIDDFKIEKKDNNKLIQEIESLRIELAESKQRDIEHAREIEGLKKKPFNQRFEAIQTSVFRSYDSDLVGIS